MQKTNNYLQSSVLLLFFIYMIPLLIHNIKKQWHYKLEKHHKIGYLSINEKINHTSFYKKHLSAYFKDTSIKAILITIESDGGTAGSCQALAYEIENLKKEYPKPIICYSENICTSGAYQVAAATDYIVATGACIIGNIGIDSMSKISPECLNNKTTESNKNNINEQNIQIQKLSTNIYQQFTKEIASKRHLQLNKIDQWGQGQLFTGQQAYDLKLIDAIGSKTTAINLIKKNIIPSDRTIEWITPYEENKIEHFFNKFNDEDEDLDTNKASFFSSWIHTVSNHNK